MLVCHCQIESCSIQNDLVATPQQCHHVLISAGNPVLRPASCMQDYNLHNANHLSDSTLLVSYYATPLMQTSYHASYPFIRLTLVYDRWFGSGSTYNMTRAN